MFFLQMRRESVDVCKPAVAVGAAARTLVEMAVRTYSIVHFKLLDRLSSKLFNFDSSC